MTTQDDAVMEGPASDEEQLAVLLNLDPVTTPTVPLWPFVGREVLGISKNTTYAAAAAGEIPTIRLGKRLVVPTAALRRMLQLDDPAPATRAS